MDETDKRVIESVWKETVKHNPCWPAGLPKRLSGGGKARFRQTTKILNQDRRFGFPADIWAKHFRINGALPLHQLTPFAVVTAEVRKLHSATLRCTKSVPCCYFIFPSYNKRNLFWIVVTVPIVRCGAKYRRLLRMPWSRIGTSKQVANKYIQGLEVQN